MTGHSDYRDHYDSIRDVFSAFRDMLRPMEKAGKLGFVLLQFPPWFDCTNKNIRYVKYAKEQLEPYKVAVEFRNQTWFEARYREETLSFLDANGMIHSICDEPQAGWEHPVRQPGDGQDGIHQAAWTQRAWLDTEGP